MEFSEEFSIKLGYDCDEGRGNLGGVDTLETLSANFGLNSAQFDVNWLAKSAGGLLMTQTTVQPLAHDIGASKR